MIKTIFFSLWFLLPIGFANIAPIIATKIFGKKFSFPLDFNLKLNNKRILGENKTLRGFFAGIFVGILTVFLQKYLFFNFPGIHKLLKIDYSLINPFILGSLCALGALGGDAIESFVKRQANIKPGKSWFPFDQMDYAIGGIIFTFLYIRLDFISYFFIFIFLFLFHPLFNIIGFILRLKKSIF